MTSTMSQQVASKFIGVPARAVHESLEAYCRLHHETVVRISGTNVVARRRIDGESVALVCGGGSGHEPAHAGFVTDRWLSAAVCGDVFASPPISSVTAAIDYIHDEQCKQMNAVGRTSTPGILVLVKNYGGDVLNFGFAVREAAARGIPALMVVIGDDVAFGADHDARRGIAGVVLLYQILGSAAARTSPRRYDVEELAHLASALLQRLRSFGASLSSCTIPGSAKNVDIADGEVELGLGIHGERGLSSVPYTHGVTQLCSAAMDRLLSGCDAESTSVVLLLNNLGATTDLEMGVTMYHSLDELRNRRVVVERAASGRYMTALDMHGVSWTLLMFDKGCEDLRELVIQLLSESQGIVYTTPAAPEARNWTVSGPPSIEALVKDLAADRGREEDDTQRRSVVRTLKSVFETLAAQSSIFNEMDAMVGDGDTGFGVERACRAVLSVIDDLPWARKPQESLRLVAKVVADAFAGTSGPLYGAFLLAAAESLPATLPDVGAADTHTALLRAAFMDGTTAVMRLGGAKAGDRTMVDVLLGVQNSAAFINAHHTKELLAEAVKSAEAAALSVRHMRASRGRTRYMGGKEVGLADPGSELVVSWLRAAYEVV